MKSDYDYKHRVSSLKVFCRFAQQPFGFFAFIMGVVNFERTNFKFQLI